MGSTWRVPRIYEYLGDILGYLDFDNADERLFHLNRKQGYPHFYKWWVVDLKSYGWVYEETESDIRETA